jgi:hypothetical protein
VGSGVSAPLGTEILIKTRSSRHRPHMLLEDEAESRMPKYRMDIFKPGRKPGHPTPLLWRRHDIYASDDTTAKAEAEEVYRTHASQRALTNFYLCDSRGRPIYESMEKEPI